MSCLDPEFWLHQVSLCEFLWTCKAIMVAGAPVIAAWMSVSAAVIRPQMTFRSRLSALDLMNGCFASAMVVPELAMPHKLFLY